MSVVAVKIYDKEIIMSADSIIVHGGDDKTPVGRGKIFEVNGMLIGSSGFASEAIHMALFAENHTPLAMDEREITKWMYEFVTWRSKEFGVDPKGEYQNCYLFAYKGKAFYCNFGYVGEVTDFYAIGAGEKYANAALYLGHSPAEAVKVACALSCYVDEPIITKSIAK
jgi:ATP-dependent protease HslVU (ClpYQ) peptidase subunit